MNPTMINALCKKANAIDLKNNKCVKLINNLNAYYYYHLLKKAAKKLNYDDIIEIDKDICGGKAVIKGTRISTETIFNYVISNEHINLDVDDLLANIKKDYPILTEETIMYALLHSIKSTPMRKFFDVI